jgi:hypothetical protein
VYFLHDAAIGTQARIAMGHFPSFKARPEVIPNSNPQLIPMKLILCLALVCGATFLTGCHEVIVDRHRPAVVHVRDRGYHRGPGYYDRGPGYHRSGYYAPGYRSSPRRGVIVY